MATLKLTHRFEADNCRHYIGDLVSVLHCHHYATLFTQLAIDAKDLVDGTKILMEVTEDVVHGVLSKYFAQNGVSAIPERLEIGQQLFSFYGLGKMAIVSPGSDGGTIEMSMAHVDEGWIKKWGKATVPVNFIGAGFVAGFFAAVYDKPVRTYRVEEKQSRVMGAAKSVLAVSL
jgi:predicted hydrocarbon binding protein